MMRVLTEEALEEQLRKNKGNLAACARYFGITRQAVYGYISTRPHLKEVQDECTETVIDTAESKLFAAINKGESWAICFFLKCRAKSRGYVEKEEEDLRRKVDKLEAIIVKLEAKLRGQRGTTKPS